MNWSWSPATSDVPEEGIFPRLAASAAAMLSAKQLSQFDSNNKRDNNKSSKNISNTTSNNHGNHNDNTLHCDNQNNRMSLIAIKVVGME